MDLIGNILLFLATSAILALIIVFSVKRMRKKFRSQLEPIANALGGELVMGFAVFYVRIPGESAETKVSITPGGKNTPPKLSILQTLPMDFQLTISTENIISSAAKKIHLIRDLETGDPIFDQKYLVQTKDQEKVQSFLLSGARREAVTYFFNNGFSRMTASQNAVSAEKNHYTVQDLDPERIRQDLEQLKRFVSG